MTNVPNFFDRHMKTNLLRRFFLQEDLNFLLTNRVPRLLLVVPGQLLLRVRERNYQSVV